MFLKALDLGVRVITESASLKGVRDYPWRRKLQSLFSAFPTGWPGLGLFVLRLVLASSEFREAFCLIVPSCGRPWVSPWYGVLAALVGVAVFLGFLTPIAATVGALGYLWYAILLGSVVAPNHLTGVTNALDLSAISLAVIFLGPGAFSIDARVFGRREIIIPESGRSRHQ